MSKYLIENTTLKGIADAIREKKGTSDPVAVSDFASEISSIEGGGGATEGGECSGVHINIVDEFPEVGVEGEHYAKNGMTDLALVVNGQVIPFKQQYQTQYGSELICITTTQDKFTDDMIAELDVDSVYMIYLTDTHEVYSYEAGRMGSMEDFGTSFIAEITDISEVDATQNGYYVCIGLCDLCRYTEGQYIKLIEKGKFQFGYIDVGGVRQQTFIMGVEGHHDENIIIPSTDTDGYPITRIYESAFEGKLFSSVEIPDSVTTIGNEAFSNCYGLTSIEFPVGVVYTGQASFNCCTGLTDVKFHDSFEMINNGTFFGCRSLTNIEIPSSVTVIGYYAFKDCTALTNITFKGTVEQWNSIEFGEDWNKNVPATKVICTDGEVALEVSGGSDESGSTTPSEVVTEEITIDPSTEDKEYTPSEGAYFSKVTVKAIPSNYVPDGYVKPSGTKSITTNDNHNVAEVEFASVNVPTYVTISSIEELSSITASDGMVAVLGG
jgi:hypothetical protein